MKGSFWQFLFGAPHSYTPSRATRQETVKRLEGLMREREQIDQSSERWAERMKAEICRYAEVSEEALTSRDGPE